MLQNGAKKNQHQEANQRETVYGIGLLRFDFLKKRILSTKKKKKRCMWQLHFSLKQGKAS